MATLLLQRLDVDTDTNSWISDWRLAVKSLNDILTLSESSLRNRLSNDRQIVVLVDNFLDIFPKNWRKDELLSTALDGNPQLDRGEEIRALIVEMYTKILMLFLKLAKQFVGEQNHQKSSLFDLNRLFHAVVIFKTSNRNAVENIITEAFDTKQFTEKDVETFIKTMEQELIDNDIAFSKSNVNKLEKFLERCLIDFEGLTVVSSLLFNHLPQVILCNFLNSVALFVEDLEEHYCIDQVMNMSTDLRGTFGIMLALVDNVIASAYAFFHTVIDRITSNDELYTVIVNCLQYERFIFYYSIIYPIEEVLNRCDEEQKIFINTTLEHIVRNCITHVLEQLKKRGMLAGLGLSATQEVQEKINYLAELLPHFSLQFIHLCLRHFGYETEQTANALLNTTELPLDLQALISVELKTENASMIVTEFSPFYDFTDDKISDGKEKINETKQSDPLVCMKPPQLSSTNKEASNAQSTSKSQTGINARKYLKAEFGIEAFLKRSKVDAQIKNKPLFTETFDVPNSEKVAQRPTYEKYRYVKTASPEYSIYDDEYDDTYDDHCQTYDLDFRSGDIAIEKAGIAPNTNRMPIHDEVNDDTGSEEENKTDGYSVRRKKQLKNGREVMNVIASDEKNQNNAFAGSGSNERHKPGYTGGRDRQLKERHKGEFRRRQADKKMRSGM
uniref:CUE domain-containing protein n=1 Tax=Elaeophora elaphi TaxID=1147741 RepID=A0A0R3S0K3_9BILA